MSTDNDEQTSRIAVLGCGPKAIALHVRSTALSNLNRKTVKVVSWDVNEPAANWSGKFGFTDGECKLGTSPLKDVTYPGTLGEDPELDKELIRFSWTSYLRCTGQMDSWVDNGYPAVTHKQWANYLKWALDESIGENRKGAIDRVERKDGKVAVYSNGHSEPELFDGFVYTGPGSCIPLQLVDSRKNIHHLLDAKTFWQEKNKVKGRIGLIGTGESTAAILEYFAHSKPDADVTVMTMFGYLPMRDEGYSANSMFSKPVNWETLPLEVRKIIINRADRGVLSPRCHEDLAASQIQVKELFGKVLRARCINGLIKTAVELEIQTAECNEMHEFDYVIAALGFDIVTPLQHLLSNVELSTPQVLMEGIDHSLRLPETQCNIHVPGLAGLAQGPGFPNLSGLSLVASRIFSTYISAEENSN